MFDDHLDTAGYRRFSGASMEARAGLVATVFSRRADLHAAGHGLILMGDWCGSESATTTRENQDAWQSDFANKGEGQKTFNGVVLLLDRTG